MCTRRAAKLILVGIKLLILLPIDKIYTRDLPGREIVFSLFDSCRVLLSTTRVTSEILLNHGEVIDKRTFPDHI